jgi:S-adenosyl-L-methionine hydrolase (adenosine-forming)
LSEMIITLLTDFGTQDYFVGAMKGVIFTINPEAKIADITHEIPPQDVCAAAFTLVNYYKTFPPGTTHVCVVDPGVGSERRAILVETQNYYFVAPDNGLLSFVFDEEQDFRVFELTNQEFFRHPVSQTFHGRDVFAPVAAHLSTGISVEEFGREINDFVRFEIAKPQKNSAGEIEGEIIHIDRFGNLITNLKGEDLPEKFVIKITEKTITKHLKYYAEAETGEIFSILGSAGFLEIVAFRDSAKAFLNVKLWDKVFLTGSEN